jgi:hypothetical protein
MKKLSSYYSLPFTQLNIRYGNEKISFSLMSELKLTESKLNDELSKQASKYGFCLLLHKKLLTIFEQLKVQKNKVYGRLYFQAKDKKSQTTGRLFTDDMAKAWVEKHPRYIKAQLACIKAKDNADAIYACIKSFEQRKDLAQSIASNLRNEK